MTREEAIKLLANATYSDEWQGNEDLTTAYNMAIKALEQEPCEDAVSRANLLKQFEDRFIELQKAHRKDLQFGINWCINTLLDAPAVTPVKTGQWVFVDKAHEHAYCSECGYGNVDLFNGRPHNYCPNCGAKMDEDW